MLRDKTQYAILAHGRALGFWNMNEPSKKKKNDSQLYEISRKNTAVGSFAIFGRIDWHL